MWTLITCLLLVAIVHSDHTRGEDKRPPGAKVVRRHDIEQDSVNADAFGNGCGFNIPHDGEPCNDPGHYENGMNGGGPTDSESRSRSGSNSGSRGSHRSSSKGSGSRSGSGSRDYDDHGLTAHGQGYECEHDSECLPGMTCSGYGVCEGEPASPSGSGSGSGSRGSRRSGSKSSSKGSGSKRSGSGSRSYDGHGSGGSVSADGNGYECDYDSECPPGMGCNGYGICEGSGSGSGSHGSGSGSRGSKRSGSKSSSKGSGSKRSGSGSRSYDGHGSGGSVSADGNGYECEYDSECPPGMGCNGYGICEGSGSESGSGSRGSKRSGSKSSSKGSGSKRSGSGSRSYDGHGSGGSMSADGVGYECETKYDCMDPQICNEYGICELAPRSEDDANSRSGSKSGSGKGSSSKGSSSKGSSSKGGSKKSSSYRNSQSGGSGHSGSPGGSASAEHVLRAHFVELRSHQLEDVLTADQNHESSEMDSDAFGNGCGFNIPHDGEPCNDPGHYENGKNGGGPSDSETRGSRSSSKGSRHSSSSRRSNSRDYDSNSHGNDVRMFVNLQADRKRTGGGGKSSGRSSGHSSGRSSGHSSGSSSREYDEDGHCEWNGVGDGNPKQYEEQCASMDSAHCGAWATDHGYDQNRCMWVPDSIRDAVAAGNLGISSEIGCIWDMTGCSTDCDETKMTTRCATLNHDKEVCESQIGKDYRCKWSHGEDGKLKSLMSTVQSTWNGMTGMMAEDVTSSDMLLGLSLLVSLVFALYQCYQWRCAGHDGYEKLQDVAGPGVPVLV